MNPRITAVPPSGIRRFFDLAATMRDTISLGVGEPDFKTPYAIRSAAIDSLIDGETQYTANRGLPELRREIARYLSSRYQITYQPEEEILVTIGAFFVFRETLPMFFSSGGHRSSSSNNRGKIIGVLVAGIIALFSTGIRKVVRVIKNIKLTQDKEMFNFMKKRQG